MPEDSFGGLLDDFFLDARERADRAEDLLLALKGGSPEQRDTLLTEVRRELHTLKGNSGMMGFLDLQSLAHEMEDQIAEFTTEKIGDVQKILEGLDRFRSRLLESLGDKTADPEQAPDPVQSEAHRENEPSIQGSVRVPFESLDQLVDLLAEMVIFKNRLADAIQHGRHTESANAWDEVESSHEALSKTLLFIQDRIMQLRMVPLQTLFGHMRRIVHDAGVQEGKEARLETIGGDTPMDKALLEVASEALGHLVRNAIVHGVEAPAVRRKAGKAAAGTVRLAATPRANEVEIVVADDGAGIDRAALLEQARLAGFEASDEHDIRTLLFRPGVSTRETADMGAGRGIGLYAALQSVQHVGGRIDVSSEIGRGSRFSLHLPLSVSIMPALLITADGEEYALPLASVVESLKFGKNDGHRMNHAGVFRWRKEIVTLLDLGYVFKRRNETRRQGYVIVVNVEGRNRGLIADDITGIREIVVKGLDALVGNPQGVSASTILGDGRVVLILDPSGLMAIKPFTSEDAVQIPDSKGSDPTTKEEL